MIKNISVFIDYLLLINSELKNNKKYLSFCTWNLPKYLISILQKIINVKLKFFTYNYMNSL